jgi:hypothetical protein
MNDPQEDISAEAVDDAFNEAQRVAKAGRAWLVPLVTAAVLAAIFCTYYFVYVAARRQYLANRNFRELALLGNQLQSIISIQGSILESYADLVNPHREPAGRTKQPLEQFLVQRKEDSDIKPDQREQRKDYLQYLSPSLETVELHNSGGERLYVQSWNGQWQMVLSAVRHQASGPDVSGKLEMVDLLNPLVESMPFDDILLVADEGKIVYQRSKSGPQFTTLADLLRAQTGAGASKPGENAGAGKDAAGREIAGGPDSKSLSQTVVSNSDPGWRLNTQRLTDVDLAGTQYKLFLQPVLVQAYTDDPDKIEPAREWIVCGLRTSSALQWEALSISYDIVIWMTAALLAICMSGPLLKISS